MPERSITGQPVPPGHDALQPWIGACLAADFELPGGDFPFDAAASEGVLPWLAYRLYETGALTGLPPALLAELRNALRRWSMMHLDCENELRRLLRSAAERGLRFLAFKGHSVARTLYPNPACRPTSDFDLLIDPEQLEQAQDWLRSMGYAPLQHFVGKVWLGAQSWTFRVDGRSRFHVDLHWDYTNRMYFRHRLSFAEIWSASREVPCGDALLRVPCRVDDLVLACVHLAAFDPGFHIRLNWLLDIYLLMAALDEADLRLLIARAQMAHALEACLAYGEMAAALGDAEGVNPVLEALRVVARPGRMRGYQRTLHWRAWDLACYWVRLPLGDKLRFFGDLVRWAKVRSYTN